ncbi:LptF/LptG family permease [Melioribacteraceae bacterium 4301-Me]|uniref:LptF/LptG family permease n=1 Tax=Pyranulibacter aquaticus TaxID=3163344 RepID=UPI003599C6E6
MKLKILDKYLIKQFLRIILFGIVTFSLLFIVIDLMENLDDFIDQKVPTFIVVKYYAVFLPEIIRLILPIAVLLAALFTSSRMANLNELTAIKSSGVSLYRYMTPFVVTSLMISLIAVYFGGYIVPEANKRKVQIEQTYMKKGLVFIGSNIFFQDTRTRIVNINHYDVDNNQAYQISIQNFDPQNTTKMTSRIDAFRMEYDSTKKVWNLFSGTERIFTDTNETYKKFTSLQMNDLHFKPEDVIKKQQKPEEMTLSELKNFANEQLKTGNDPTQILIDYHSRIAFAFASLVVVLFGIPISTNKRKGGIALQFGINLTITFIYLVFAKISEAFGKNGVMNPFFTAWFANFIFLLAALFNIYRVQK